MRIMIRLLVPLLVSIPGVLSAAGVPEGSTPAPGPADTHRVIAMHVGIPERVYLGQPLKELLEHFPKARVVPFAGQSDALQVQILDAGISCLVTGSSPEELQVSAVGFNFDLRYEGVAGGDFRTVEGIGRGSTVEDLMRAYGPPSEVIGPKTNKLQRRPADTSADADIDLPRKHLYNNPDGTVSTYFVVEQGSVRRVSINDLAPLDRHILRRGPEAATP